MSIQSDTIEYITVAYERRIHETTRAVLYLFEGDQEEWIPKSQIEDEDTEAKAITIPKWLAAQRGVD